MPAPSRPSQGRPPTFPKQDDNIWKAYTKALQAKFFSNLDTKNEIFCAAPAWAMGIPIGYNIPQEVTNKGIYEIGDTLMRLDARVFTVGSKKYSQRLEEALGAVKLKKIENTGDEKRLSDSQANVRKLNGQYADMGERAMECYVADEEKGNQGFKQWTLENFPNFATLAKERQSAVATEASLRDQYEGSGASQLNQQRYKVFRARSLDTDYPGMNMLCAPSFGNTIDGSSNSRDGSGKLLRPAYTTDNSYRNAATNWAADIEDDNQLKLTFNINDVKSDNWDQFGFVDVNANQGSNYSTFFKASYFLYTQKEEEVIAAEDIGSDLEVQLSAAKVGVFNIKPGDWDVPNITQEYPNFQPDTARNIGSAARVDQVVMAYKVAMEFSLPEKVAERVNDLTLKAKMTGGSVSFFGYEFAFGSGKKDDEVSVSGSSIAIRKDLGFPVLLGVKGKKLPAPRTGR